MAALLAATLASGASATFPGTNGQIAFAAFDPAAEKAFIYSILPDGTDEQQLTAFDSGSPDWSPDGSKIAFDFLASDGCTDIACEVEIGVMNADGSGFVQLTSGDPFFRFSPSWSPDGAMLAIVRFDGIWTIDAATGSNETQVTDNPYIEDRAPTWSPDGEWIAFTRVRHQAKREQTAIFAVHPDGSDVHRVTNWGINADSPDWAPDGSKIAFNTKGTNAAPSRIATIEPDGTGMTYVVKSTSEVDFHEPSWSPDGTDFTFQGWLLGAGAHPAASAARARVVGGRRRRVGPSTRRRPWRWADPRSSGPTGVPPPELDCVEGAGRLPGEPARFSHWWRARWAARRSCASVNSGRTTSRNIAALGLRIEIQSCLA